MPHYWRVELGQDGELSVAEYWPHHELPACIPAVSRPVHRKQLITDNRSRWSSIFPSCSPCDQRRGSAVLGTTWVENGRVTRASLDKQPHEVASMFDDVAANYDLTNDVLSLGQARLWRKEVAQGGARAPRREGPRPGGGHRHLVAAVRRRPAPTSCPATSRSACCAEGKKRHPWMPFTAGDATRLPFADEVFDAVTISFGLRNVQDTDLRAA